jgi:hypothetical protein
VSSTYYENNHNIQAIAEGSEDTRMSPGRNNLQKFAKEKDSALVSKLKNP